MQYFSPTVNPFFRLGIALIICWVIGVPGIAQKKELDSLKNALQNHPAQDTTRMFLLNKLASELCYKDVKQATQYLQEAEQLAQKLHSVQGKARNLRVSGLIQFSNANFDQAFEHLQQALAAFKTLGNQLQTAITFNTIAQSYYYRSNYRKALNYFEKYWHTAKTMNNQSHIGSALAGIGLAYSDLGEYEKSLKHFEQSVQVYKKLNKKGKIANCFNNMGTIYDDQGNHPQASEYYNKALSLYKTTGNHLGASRVLNNLGIIYKNRGDYEKALGYYKQALQVNRDLGKDKNVSAILNNIGSIYFRQKKIKEALKYHYQSLELNKKTGHKRQTALSLNNIGNVQLKIKNYTLALRYYQQALTIILETENQVGLSSIYTSLGNVYFYQGVYHKALHYALKSKEIADKHEMKLNQRDNEEILARIYYSLKDYQKAYKHHVAYKKLYDEIFNKRSIQKITQLEYQYKYQKTLALADQREQILAEKVKVADLNLAKSQRQMFLIIIAFLLFILVSGFIMVFLRLRTLKSERQNILVEQKLLRSQMTPHFIFNSLAVLQGIILNEEYPKSITYLSKFSKLLRIILENSRNKIVPLENELKVIENYLIVQNLGNTSSPYHYTINVEKNIEQQNVLIPPMMIQPFVENAIEHGFAAKKEDRQIEVKVQFDQEALICLVKDNGVGISTEETKANTSKKSLSTTITSERLQIFAKEFKVKTGLSIKNNTIVNQQGTTVTLMLPYKIKENDENTYHRR